MQDEGLKEYIKERPIPEKLIRNLQIVPLIKENDPVLSVGGNALALLKRRRKLKLTKIEKHVLFLMSHGFTVEMIAKSLFKSQNTIFRHLGRIRAVLNTNNNCQSVGLALRAGLID